MKGTDGEETLRKAIALGAEPVAPQRAIETLRELRPVKEKISLITYPREMGEDEAKGAGFTPKVIGRITSGRTKAEDTKRAAAEMRELSVDLLLFVAGDGTARDVFDVVKNELPVIGVPAGVKMHSAVFTVDPKAAAEIVMKFLWEELPFREAEVMDIDEEAYRAGRVSAKLYGYMLVPYEPSLVQGSKLASLEAEEEAGQQEAIAKHVIEKMEPGVVYLLGPGTTTRAVVHALGEEKTLLGVDVIQDGKVVARDVNERQILGYMKGRKAKIIVSPIGGQGFILGRGNQQLSSEVVRRVGRGNVVVLATPQKLAVTPSLRVDIGDSKLDGGFRGFIEVVTGYRQTKVVRVS